jgi:predicted  nucleic acid-binding Zn-ribbon protein
VEDSFKLLEDRVRRAAERLKELQSETESLRGELASAQSRAAEAEKRLEDAAGSEGSRARDSKKAESLAREVKALKKEREEIRSRIGRLVELLETLE